MHAPGTVMDSDKTCANPLLLGWLGEWLEEARQRNSKGFQTYRKAFDSMKACPLAFNHPSEAQQLHGLGPKLCDRLTAKLAAHCKENGLPMPEPQAAQKRSNEESTDVAAAPAKKARQPKAYVPMLRSGPYAILHALSSAPEADSRSFTKDEVIGLAQPYCDSSFTAPSDPTKYFTAWNSMKTLIDKDLVYERGRPLRKYALTEDGWEVAKRIRKPKGADRSLESTTAGGKIQTTIAFNNGSVQGGPSVQRPPRGSRQRSIFSDGSDVAEWLSSPPPEAVEGMSRPQTANVPIAPLDKDASIEDVFPPVFEPIVMPASSFEVHLVLDNREVRAKQDRDYIKEELTRKGVRPIMKSLEAGDALWIAKRRRDDGDERPIDETDEIVLDWIVERKRLDDLVGSIKDGRFREQKFRLRRSGVKNVVYIIEEITLPAEMQSKYQEATESAIASTQVVDGYFVKRTAKVDDTIRYLARMTMLLKSVYESKPLHIIPTKVLTPQNYLPLLAHLRETTPSVDHHITYSAFAHLASKSEFLTLRDVYVKMLMCTKGVTGDKALEIQKQWSTPVELIDAYRNCGRDEAGRVKQMGLMAGELSGLVGRKKIGKALSGQIADVWGFS
ncbi:MAG: hypothetical protein M1823_004176 [Watsoniomyces obsoletus]|nr:MAG: hypothetical protein M1823_004176 [Watsoniomyces obsoletus]